MERIVASEISKPPSLPFKPMKTQWKDLFKCMTALAANVATGNFPSAGANVAGVLTAFQFDRSKPQEVAWAWISRSMLRAVSELIDEQPAIAKEQIPTNVDEIAEEFADVMEASGAELSEALFKRPKEAAFLKDFREPCSRWIGKFGLPQAHANTIAGRLPGYFAVSLDEEWRERPADYGLVKEALDGPATEAARQEMAWRAYFARLQKEVDEQVFDEHFGLAQIYIWPRAYYEEREEPAGAKSLYDNYLQGKVKRTAFWLKDHLLEWLQKRNSKDSLRVISGGPGSGKSSFTKMFAAELAAQGLPVLRIPLHRLNLQKDWEAAVTEYVKNHVKLDLNPFNPPGDESVGLLIFDGVDELVQEGKKAEELVTSFLDHVRRELGNVNDSKLRVQVIVSGRELVIQSQRSALREDRLVLHLLPYHLEDEERTEFDVTSKLLDLDQRDEWWQKYTYMQRIALHGMPRSDKARGFRQTCRPTSFEPSGGQGLSGRQC